MRVCSPVRDSEALAQSRELKAIDAPILPGQRARRVHAGDRDFVIGKERLEIVADVAPVAVEAAEEAEEEIAQRDVVIARHDDLRERNPFEKLPRRDVFDRARALREVAGDRDDVRLRFTDERDQRIENRRMNAAEMQIRKVDERAH